jgi:hypothetical protein
VKKAALSTALTILLLAGTLIAQSDPRAYISDYETMDLDFLRSHYTEINNGRPIKIEGFFSSYKWLQPYEWKARLTRIGLDSNDYNLIQMTLKENDDFHYSFPILLFHSGAGNLNELERLYQGIKVAVYGRFYKLRESEYAIQVDVVEVANVSTHVDPVGTPVFKIGGHDRIILLDGRVSPSPTPTFTITPTPQPSLWQKVNNMINPKETITPTGTVTPGT